MQRFQYCSQIETLHYLWSFFLINRGESWSRTLSSLEFYRSDRRLCLAVIYDGGTGSDCRWSNIYEDEAHEQFRVYSHPLYPFTRPHRCVFFPFVSAILISVSSSELRSFPHLLFAVMPRYRRYNLWKFTNGHVTKKKKTCRKKKDVEKRNARFEKIRRSVTESVGRLRDLQAGMLFGWISPSDG